MQVCDLDRILSKDRAEPQLITFLLHGDVVSGCD